MPGAVNGTDGDGEPAGMDSTELYRRSAIRIYLAISLVQVVTGLVAFACSAISVHYHNGGRLPYFSGSFSIASVLLVLSMIAFRVYNKGPLFTTCRYARKEVLCALSWHRGISFLAFFVCVFGLAIIWMYGLCITDDKDCSYDEHIRTNKTLAIIVFVLGGVGLVTAAIGVLLIRKFGDAFGVEIVQGRRGDSLRYVSTTDDAMSELRRQNAEMQRQLREQSSYPHTSYGCHGVTNFAFEPTSPPPYSPAGMGVTTGCVQIGQSLPTIGDNPVVVSRHPPKYSELELSVIPSDPPPAYKETSGDDDDVTHDDRTNA